MGPSKRTLAIVALTTTLVSCSPQSLPATTPTTPANPPRIYTTTATQPLMIDLTLAYSERYSTPQFDIFAGNYQDMLNMLYQGDIAYFVTNHLPADSIWAAPIAQDGIVIITHSSVQIKNISLDDLRRIYQGSIHNWMSLGGADIPITVFSREAGSSTRAEFDTMVMGYRQTTANARVASSSMQMVNQVANQPGSIGYVSMGFVDERVQVMAVENILPNLDTVYEGIYPLRSTIFVVGLAEPEGIFRHFLGWVQSPDGQRIVEQRYVPIMMSN
ncbi:MAG: phosphate ABC transporter substrate-binding protein [Phototrophicales bacterium]